MSIKEKYYDLCFKVEKMKEKIRKIEENNKCSNCNGEGKISIKCSRCGGYGNDHDDYTCYLCNGSGLLYDRCLKCNGLGFILK